MARQSSSPEIELGLTDPPPVSHVRGDRPRPPKLPQNRTGQSSVGAPSEVAAPGRKYDNIVAPPPTESDHRAAEPDKSSNSKHRKSKSAKEQSKKKQDEVKERGGGLRSLGAAFISTVIHLVVCIALAVTALPSLMKEGLNEIVVDVASETEDTIDDFEVNELTEVTSEMSVVDIQQQLDASSHGIGGTLGDIGIDRAVADQANEALAVAGRKYRWSRLRHAKLRSVDR